MDGARRVHGKLQLRLSVSLHLHEPAGAGDVRALHAALVYRIDRGHHGDITLDGLKFALVIRSGKVMADGNWMFAGVVDEAADEAQRKAVAIVGGKQAARRRSSAKTW